MAVFELIMPKMGESIIEATILNWLKREGDAVEVDETILEIATDKVDSEIPSPVKGVIKELIYQTDTVVPVGETIALIQTEVNLPKDSNGTSPSQPVQDETDSPSTSIKTSPPPAKGPSSTPKTHIHERIPPVSGHRFYSPLVRKIAREEGVSLTELEGIPGSGQNDRVTKKDIISFIEQKRSTGKRKAPSTVTKAESPARRAFLPVDPDPIHVDGSEEIVEMERTRKLIAQHMIDSRRTSAHVTSFVEVDVSNIVQWRDANKDAFQHQHGTKLTFTPIFIEALVRAIRDFPLINASVQNDQIILKKKINIGLATAVPDGHLIVPVIKQADNYSLVGLANMVNDLAERARTGGLKPEEIQEGTFTITNVGTFGNVMGTPIINQPQIAILATGAIKKKPAVVETEYGDLIAIRHMMFLSLSYDHRIIDGFYGGSFLRRIADYLEQFEDEDTIK